MRLVDADGSQLGIKPLPEALHIAREADLHLVEVAAQANPPVCRIMDYGKYKFDAAQRARESRRKTSNVSIKEMKYRPKIGSGDFDTKTRKVAHFLGEGHKVKVTIMFRGREMSHPELGKKILDRVAEDVINVGKVELFPKLDGRNMIMVLAPDRRAQAAAAHSEKNEAAGAEPDLAPAAEIAAPEIAAPETATAETAETEAPTITEAPVAPEPATEPATQET
ncbi:MAG: translation initiation factor [Actinomycetota bacterium]|nr:translation initiation factor [Actinomycetota bacterium]